MLAVYYSWRGHSLNNTGRVFTRIITQYRVEALKSEGIFETVYRKTRKLENIQICLV